MAGLYSNKFTVEITDIARIVFSDERASVTVGNDVADIVMTHDNLRQLGELIAKCLSHLKN